MKTLETLQAEFIRDITSMRGLFHTISKSEVKRRLDEIIDFFDKQRYIQEIPYIGVSQWRNYGIKYKYYDYFEKKALKEQKKTLRKRHFQEFLIMANKMEKKDWSFNKFLKYMCLINEKTDEELRLLTKKL